MDLLAAILGGAPVPEELPTDLQAPLCAVRDLIAVVRDRSDDAVAEDILWTLWRKCGLESGLVAASSRGGLVGQRADATLDAVLLLFDAAAERERARSRARASPISWIP